MDKVRLCLYWKCKSILFIFLNDQAYLKSDFQLVESKTGRIKPDHI